MVKPSRSPPPDRKKASGGGGGGGEGGNKTSRTIAYEEKISPTVAKKKKKKKKTTEIGTCVMRKLASFKVSSPLFPAGQEKKKETALRIFPGLGGCVKGACVRSSALRRCRYQTEGNKAGRMEEGEKMEEEERERDTENAKGKLGRAGVSSEISVHAQFFFASFSSTTMTGRNYFLRKFFSGFIFQLEVLLLLLLLAVLAPGHFARFIILCFQDRCPAHR